MPNITKHQSLQTTKILLIGDSKCLAGDTIISIKRGIKYKKLDLATVFSRVNGHHHNKSNAETFVLADLGGYAGSSRLLEIVKAGVKPLFRVVSRNGKSIKASADHQFLTDSGWMKLSDLQRGTPIKSWRSSRANRFHSPVRQTNVQRAWIYSIPHHPFGQDNWVAGRNYKRNSRARLTLEAAINGLNLDEFVRILRNDPNQAASLQYTNPRDDIHHKDGDFSNDDISNLEILPMYRHRADHIEQRNFMKDIVLDYVEFITEVPEEMTYDLVMEAPNNFIANGFVVHNSGKTGSLCSLAAAGYKLRILDLDNGMDLIRDFMTHPASPYVKALPSVAENVEYRTLTEPYKNVGGKLSATKATVWPEAIKMLMEWKYRDGDDEINLGSPKDWGNDVVLVVDSLSMLATAAMNFHLMMNSGLGVQRSGYEYQRDIGSTQNLLRDFLNLIFDKSLKCNVILTSHITFVSETGGVPNKDKNETGIGYPSAVGRALSPHIPRYFNSMLICRQSGSGKSVRRVICTVPQNIGGQIVAAGTSAPLSVAAEYPVETGLADYFAAVRGAPK